VPVYSHCDWIGFPEATLPDKFRFHELSSPAIFALGINSTQLNEHVRTQVLTPQCPHLFNTTTYETTYLLLHVLIYVQFSIKAYSMHH